jgi:hypothetical protein
VLALNSRYQYTDSNNTKREIHNGKGYDDNPLESYHWNHVLDQYGQFGTSSAHGRVVQVDFYECRDSVERYEATKASFAAADKPRVWRRVR